MSDFPMLPAGFRFGTSTAAYQIEGAFDEDGKGPSIWDTFTARPGAIHDGSSGQIACDHYHRCREDVALMRELGAGGYRFSVSWPRIQPTGTGAANAAGLAFYDRLVDELLEAGIAPMVTLYHWDLPQALEDDGGWLNRLTAQRFSDYAAILAETLGDRVEHWIPINEPNVVTMLGYAQGEHAPGRTLTFDALPAAHHLLLAHGLGTQALRAQGVRSVGTANNHQPAWAASEEEADQLMAGLFDSLWNWLFADPMLRGSYPEDLAPLLAAVVEPGDLESIAQPLDFYGVNHYNPFQVAAAPEGADLPFELTEIEGYPRTDFGWPVIPQALTQMLVGLRDRFGAGLPPIFITEGGCSYGMGPDAAGVVDDQPRIDYLDAHLRAVADAVAAGVAVRGYYVWSLLDNFEWAEGFTQRFGLVHVDYDTLARTKKRSFDWLSRVIAAQPAR